MSKYAIRVTIGDVESAVHDPYANLAYYWCESASVRQQDEGVVKVSLIGLFTVDGKSLNPIDTELVTSKPVYIEQMEQEGNSGA